MLKSTAMFLAIESTNAVLPMAGRAAMMIRSEFCHPEVMASNSEYPVARPDRPLSRFAAACICCIAWLMTVSTCTTSRLSCVCEISNNSPSAACSRSSISLASSNACPSILEAKAIRRRARYFCAIIRAWNSIWAADVTRAVSSVITTAPPTRSNVPLALSCSTTVSMSMGRWLEPSCDTASYMSWLRGS